MPLRWAASCVLCRRFYFSIFCYSIFRLIHVRLSSQGPCIAEMQLSASAQLFSTFLLYTLCAETAVCKAGGLCCGSHPCSPMSQTHADLFGLLKFLSFCSTTTGTSALPKITLLCCNTESCCCCLQVTTHTLVSAGLPAALHIQ